MDCDKQQLGRMLFKAAKRGRPEEVEKLIALKPALFVDSAVGATLKHAPCVLLECLCIP